MFQRPIETPRLLIRRFTLEDDAFILELLNEPGWIRYIGDRNLKTLEDARGYLAKGPLASYEHHGFGLSLVSVKESGASAGMAGLIRRETLPDVDVGFAFLERHMGRGYAREAAQAVIAAGWEPLGLPRIVAITTTDNERSIHLLEGIGFSFERVFRLPDDDEDLNLYALERPGSAATPPS